MKRIGILIALCVSILIITGCSNSISTTQAKLGQEFSLSLGQTAVITDEDLEVKFLKVVEDSRCPSDAVCIQIGQVSCLLEIALSGSMSNVTLIQNGGGTEGLQQVGDYTFLFDVTPHPVSTRQIKKSEYRLRLMITRADIRVSLGTQFAIAIGQSASIASENINFEFINITEDSRCPSGVTCIWAGRVSCSIEILRDRTKSEKILTQSGLTEGYATDLYEQYQLKFRVEPYPQSKKTINQSDYRLMIEITK